jgi:hypothetical protein
MRDERISRNVPPNPPPPAAQPRWLDRINCGSWLNQAVMQYLIDCANRKNGACYPSNETIAEAVRCSLSTVKRAMRFWRRNGHRVHGITIPFLRIALYGRSKRDGTKESNAYHIGWQALIAFARDYHYKLRVRVHAAAILRQKTEKVA